MEQPDLPLVVIPMKFLIKFEPPLIGLMYKRDENDQKKYIYNILLNDLLTLPTPEDITKQLFIEHEHFLSRDKVSFEQVQGLVIKLIEYLIALQEMNEANDEGEFDENRQEQEEFQMNEQEMREYYMQQQMQEEAQQKKQINKKKGLANEW